MTMFDQRGQAVIGNQVNVSDLRKLTDGDKELITDIFRLGLQDLDALYLRGMQDISILAAVVQTHVQYNQMLIEYIQELTGERFIQDGD